MGIKKIFLILVTITCFFSCGFYRKSKPSKKNYDLRKSVQYVEYDGKVDTIYRIDTIYTSFKIFASENLYAYKANYYNSSGTCISSGTVKIDGTNEKFSLASTQRAANFLFEYSIKDSTAFSPHPLNKTLSLWKRSVVEGVVENETTVWMHPFRYNQFVWTEIMAYPEIFLPIKDGYKWKATINIPKGSGWGDWEGKSINSDYLIQGKETFQIGKKKIGCWVITAKSIMDGKEGYAKFLFNEDLGFVKMEYTHYLGDRITFDMIKFIKKV